MIPRRANALIVLVMCGACASASRRSAPGDSVERLIALKRHVIDANYRNDRQALRASLAELMPLEADSAIRPLVLYHEALARWFLAASLSLDADTAAARTNLESALAGLRRALALDTSSADLHALAAFVINALALSDRTRIPQLLPELRLHRQRALALGPQNPRVIIMDASLLFYAPPPAGSQDLALARWNEALHILESERPSESASPDWGGALAYGWLANLYLDTSPPKLDEAQQMARRALELRPDFWWVRTQVLPRISGSRD